MLNEQSHLTQKKETEENDLQNSQLSSGQQDDPELQAEVVGNWKIVDLPIVSVSNGEQGETQIASFKTKLYRFNDGQWKERGNGRLRFLKDNSSGKTRMILRTDKTFQIRLNHKLIKNEVLGILEKSEIEENSWIWAANDWSSYSSIFQKFMASFDSSQEAERFRLCFQSQVQSKSVLEKENSQEEIKKIQKS